MQKITPFLWFDGRAEEAMNFYASVFKNSHIGAVSRAGDKVMTASFQLEGLNFTALNGGPHFKFNEAISFQIDCADQQEVDYFWDKLCEGGSPSRCGWLKDKFGVSWQVVPSALPRLLKDSNADKAGRVMQAMMKMAKIDVAALEAAAG